MRKVEIIALVLLLLGATIPSVSAGDLLNYIWDTRTYQHPYPTDVRPGDLVYGHSPDLFNAIIPGYWIHVAIVAWYNDTIDDWMVIEAKIGKGVIISRSGSSSAGTTSSPSSALRRPTRSGRKLLSSLTSSSASPTTTTTSASQRSTPTSTTAPSSSGRLISSPATIR